MVKKLTLPPLARPLARSRIHFFRWPPRRNNIEQIECDFGMDKKLLAINGSKLDTSLQFITFIRDSF